MIKNNQYVVDRLYTDIVTTDVIDKDETIIIYNNSSGGGGLTTEQASKLAGIQSGAEVNQNAFSFVTLPSGTITTLAAISKTDTLKISGTSPINITIDENRNLTFSLDSSSLTVHQHTNMDALNLLSIVDGKLQIIGDVYATGEVSAYGIGSENPGIVMELKQLADVSDDLNPVDKDLLYYDATVSKWISKPSSSITTDLTNYYNISQTNSAISTAVANLVNSAPTTLDTLNELATALGNDPNFATTITSLIGTKWTQDNTKITNWDSAYTKVQTFDNILSHFSIVEGKLQIDIDTYSLGELSAYGLGIGGGSSATDLNALTDVTLTSLLPNDLLYYNGSFWVNTPVSSFLSSYATQSWVNSRISTLGCLTGVVLTNPVVNDTLIYNGTNWVNSTTGGGGNILSHIFYDAINNRLYTDVDFYSEGSISAYGIGTGQSSGGASTLYQLTDVSENNANDGVLGAIEGSVLKYNSTTSHWEAMDLVSTLSTKWTTNNTSISHWDNAYTHSLISGGSTIHHTHSNKSLLDSISQENIDVLLHLFYDDATDTIKVDKGFWSTGEISAYGIGSGGSGTVTSLSQLTDVIDTLSPINGDVLYFDSTESKWVNKASSLLQPSLTNYYTKTETDTKYALIDHVHTFASLTSKPTTIGGYGITDAVLTTDSRLSNARYNPFALTFTGYVSAVYDGSNTVSISLPTKLSQFTNDSGYLTSITFTDITSKPTTLSGYGITDAASSTHTHYYASSSTIGGKANSVANQLTFSGYSTLSYDGSTPVTIPIPSNTSELTNGAGFITSSGSITGNAATATKLVTARTISVTGVVTGSGSFDGSGNLAISTSISADSITLGTNTVGNYALSVGTSGNGLSITGTAGEGIAYTVNSNATNLNTVSTLVFRDVNGDFSMGGLTTNRPNTFKGVTTMNPTLGGELVSTGWTLNTGWTGTFGTGFTHTTGNVGTLNNTLSAVNTNRYQIEWTITNRTTGYITISFGGQSYVTTSSEKWGPTTTNTNTFVITPSSDFNGKVVISVKQITTASSALVELKNSLDTIVGQIRINTDASNTIIGHTAGIYVTSGINNTIYGNYALQNLTTGNYNCAFGQQALRYITTSGTNIGIGASSGLIDNSGNNNITSSSSIYIGYNTKPLINGDTNEIIIGHTAIGNGSNTVTIGNNSITNTYLKGVLHTNNNTITGGNIYPSVEGSITIGTTTNRFYRAYISERIMIGAPTIEGDSNPSIMLRGDAGSMEFKGATPFIDFHFNNSTADFTSRLIEDFSGQLSISGKLMIGNTFVSNSTYQLYVNGTSYFSGDLVSAGEITAYYTSDSRLKQNVINIESSLEVLDKLRPVKYNWNDLAKQLHPSKTDNEDYGLIAQELEKVLPNLVHESNGYKSIDYIKLIPYLIKAIKELKEQINNNL